MYTQLFKASAIAAVAIMVTLMPLTLNAESIPMRGPIPFSAYDKNANGTIEKSEFYQIRDERIKAREDSGRPMRNAANAPEFSEFDANSDGKLTPQELKAGQDARMQNRRGRGMVRAN